MNAPRSRAACSDLTKWDAGIERVYPEAERNTDLATAEAAMAAMQSFAELASPNDCSNEAIRLVLQQYRELQKIRSDLDAYAVLVRAADPRGPTIKPVLERINQIVGQFVPVRNATLLALAKVAGPRLESLWKENIPQIASNVGAASLEALQMTTEEANRRNALVRASIAAAREALEMHSQITTTAHSIFSRLDAPPSAEQSKAYSDSVIALYAGRGDAFAAAIRVVADAQQPLAHEGGAGVRDYLAQTNGVPEITFSVASRAIRDHLGPLQRFNSWKRHRLGGRLLLPDSLLGKTPSIPGQAVAIDKAFRSVLEACKPLGPDFAAALRELSAERRIDSCPNPERTRRNFVGRLKGKPFVFLDYDGSFSAIKKLSHELSHAAHDVLAAQCQSAQFAPQIRLCAEIPAAVNESLYFLYSVSRMTTTTDKNVLLFQEVSECMSQIYQTWLAAEFEIRAYERIESGDTFDAHWLSAQYSQLLQEFYGESMQDLEAAGALWANQAHYFNQPLTSWVYPLARAMGWRVVAGILQGGDIGAATLQSYLEFLRAGSSLPTGELLSKLGIDLNSWQWMQAAFDHLSSLMDQLESAIPAPSR